MQQEITRVVTEIIRQKLAVVVLSWSSTLQSVSYTGSIHRDADGAFPLT